jgi:hypothetical protein
MLPKRFQHTTRLQLRIVMWLLKCATAEPEEADFDRQRPGEHIPAASDSHATMGDPWEAMFSSSRPVVFNLFCSRTPDVSLQLCTPQSCWCIIEMYWINYVQNNVLYFLLNKAWLGQNFMSIKTSFTKLTINFFYLIYYIRYLITKSLPLNYLVII